MDGEDSDGSTLFGEDVYNLLREDSVVNRFGSFAQLDQTNSPFQNETPGDPQFNGNHPDRQVVRNENPIMTQEHSLQNQTTYQYNHQDQFSSAIFQATVSTRIEQIHNGQNQLVINNAQTPQVHAIQEQPYQPYPSQQQHDYLLQEDSQFSVWDSIENETPVSDTLRYPTIDDSVALVNVEENAVPSLQPWSGMHNFKVSFTNINKDRNKWCYSELKKRLYLCPVIAVPMDITLSPWVDAKVRITPVYEQSQYRTVPVDRCFNCKCQRACDPQIIDHIIQLDNSDSQYEVLPDQRHVVTATLARPSPGEISTTLLLKLMCMTSCVGGPNRRPFSLVVTLHCKITGRIIGRQIVGIKCCKCPYRDMCNEEKIARENSVQFPTAPVLEEEKCREIQNLAAQIKVTSRKRKKPNKEQKYEVAPKIEPGTDHSGFVTIEVPAEFEDDVKKYINGLMAAKLLRNSNADLLLFPEND